MGWELIVSAELVHRVGTAQKGHAIFNDPGVHGSLLCTPQLKMLRGRRANIFKTHSQHDL